VEPTKAVFDAVGFELGTAVFFLLKVPRKLDREPPLEPFTMDGSAANFVIDLLPPEKFLVPKDKDLLLLAS